MGRNRKASKKNRRRDRLPVTESSWEEWKRSFGCVLEFLFELWRLSLRIMDESVRKFAGFGTREEGKSPSSLENQGSNSGVRRAGKHDIEEQSEGPAEEVPSFGTVNDKHHCRDPIPTGHGNEVLSLGGDEAKVYVGGYQRQEEAEVNSLKRLTDEDEIKSERPCAIGSTCKRHIEDLKRINADLKTNVSNCKRRIEDLKKINADLKTNGSTCKRQIEDLQKEIACLQKKIADLENVIANLQKSHEQFRVMVDVREIHSNFRSSLEGKNFEGKMKEVLQQMAAETANVEIDGICDINKRTSYTRMLFAMLFQRDKPALMSRFKNAEWRLGRRFPKFDNNGTDYRWWEQNWNGERVEMRLEIMRQAANKWNPDLEIFAVFNGIADLNSLLHPEFGEIEFCKHVELKHEGVDILATVRHLHSSG